MTEFSRRAFAALGASALALAAAPALAAEGQPPAPAPTAIHTDDKGLVAGFVKVPSFDREITAYRAYPRGKRRAAVILVMPEIFGLVDNVQDIVRRFAKAGYYTIAPAYYERYGDATRYWTSKEYERKLIRDMVEETKEAEVQIDTDAALAFAAREGADVRKLGLWGNSWGGRQVWKYTARNDKVKAGVAFSGPLVATPKDGVPVQGSVPGAAIYESSPAPLDYAARYRGRMLGLYGGKDVNIRAEHIAAMRDALAKAGDKGTTIDVYPDAPHGFFLDYKAGYAEAAAKDAWRRALAWFRAHGVA